MSRLYEKYKNTIREEMKKELEGHFKWVSPTIIGPAKWSTFPAENSLSFAMKRVFYAFRPAVPTWVVWWSGTGITTCSYAPAMGGNTTPRDEMWKAPHPVRWSYLASDLMKMDFSWWMRIRL